MFPCVSFEHFPKRKTEVHFICIVLAPNSAYTRNLIQTKHGDSFVYAQLFGFFLTLVIKEVDCPGKKGFFCQQCHHILEQIRRGTLALIVAPICQIEGG